MNDSVISSPCAKKNSNIKKLALFATLFALIVVILGAFTRLTHAGLGCPDWPGCYGFFQIPTEQHHIDTANQLYPDQPYQFEKAWPEMVHRYFAGTLGLLVLALAVISWRSRDKFAIKHSTFLLVLVVFQAALGMWTVTLKLHPSVVMGHLLGGFSTLSLLAALTARYHFRFSLPISIAQSLQYKKIILVTLIICALQVALGGWTSANYAAMVCHELPICQGSWLVEGDFINGFQMWGREAATYEFGILEQEARIAIHASHRIGAFVATFALLVLIYQLFKQTSSALLKQFAMVLSGLLLVQILLGVNNVVSQLPLANAVAHNAVGALLILCLVSLYAVMLMPKQLSPEKIPND